LFAARQEVDELGFAGQIEIEPHEALLTCVRISAAHVAYCIRKVEGLRSEEEMGRVVHSSEKTYMTDGGEVTYHEESDLGPALHAWIQVQHECLDRLARYSKMAIDAGVEERRVRLAERWSEEISAVLQGILSDLRLTPGQKKEAPAIVRKHLVPLETGAKALT
jgi:hypothetical protein